MKARALAQSARAAVRKRQLLLVEFAIVLGFVTVAALMETGISSPIDWWLAQRTVNAHLGALGLATSTMHGVTLAQQPSATRGVRVERWIETAEWLAQWVLAAPYNILAVSAIAGLAAFGSSLGSSQAWAARRRLRKAASGLILIAVAVLICALAIPAHFMRFGPYRFPLSFPDMFVAAVVAFYGFAVDQVRMLSESVFLRNAAAAMFTAELLGVVWAPLYFGDFWLTDVTAGGLLGCAVLVGAKVFYVGDQYV